MCASPYRPPPAQAQLLWSTVDRGAFRERYASGAWSTAGGARDLWSQLSALLPSPERGALHVRLFGPGTIEVPPALADRVHVDTFAAPCAEPIDAVGVQAFAVEAGERSRLEVFSAGKPGWRIEAPELVMAYVPSASSGHADPTVACLETLELGFAQVRALGLAPRNVVRTWFHFADVLSQYDAFNAARRVSFTNHRIATLPASTGIQGRHVGGHHLVMGALAYGGGARWAPISNPLQGEAPAYGSLFSRAVRVEGSGPAQWLVSGTAAIRHDGQTCHPEDPVAQLLDTIARVEGLLRAGGLGWSNVVGGVMFLAPAHRRTLAEAVRRTPLVEVPIAPAVADVCRPDLAFELEITAFG